MMFDFFVKLLMSEWKKFFIGTVILCLAGSSWLYRSQRNLAEKKITTLQEKVDMLQAEKDAAIAATERTKREYDKALNDAKANTQTLVEQAEKNAIANFKKRYGGSLCSGFAGGVRLPTATSARSGEAVSPKVANGIPEEFVAACAHDAALLAGWQDWATQLTLPVKE